MCQAQLDSKNLAMDKIPEQCYLTGLSVMVEMSISALSVMTATSHIWLLSTWNVTSETKELHV